MKALEYEYLIRAAFQVSRGFKHGADADIYRTWERAIYGLELHNEILKNGGQLIDMRSIDEIEYEIRVKAASIRENLRSAVSNVVSNVNSDLQEKLKALLPLLNVHEFEKEKIDFVMNQISILFQELKLKVS